MKKKITKVSVDFTCDNAAFDEEEYSEIADIFVKIARSFRHGIYPDDIPTSIRDSNGNKVGSIEIETEEVPE